MDRRNRELAELIRLDLEKRRDVKEMQKLERMYEEIQKNNENSNKK